MPFFPERVAASLESTTEAIRTYGRADEAAIEAYRSAYRDAVDRDAAAIERALDAGPAADDRAPPRPTAEWARGPILPFEASADWADHEAVTEHAATVLEGVTTAAVDGSALGPVEEFTVPLGLTQVAWCVNHHAPEGDHETGVETRVLEPDAVTETAADEAVRYVDARAPAHARYVHEGRAVADRIEALAGRDPPPVVFYDGPLVPSFANNFEPEVRDRYRETMARALAASKRHAVPVVGYTTGSERASLARLLRRIDDGLTSEPLVTDGRIVEGLADNWGDRSPLFVNRTIDADIDAGSGLAATYAGREYEFGDRVLFTYLDGGDTTDRVEVPRWVLDADLAEHVLDVVRAEAAVGRGYPELLQQADANAVLGAGAKREFLALVQRFAEEHDLPVDWNRKALSKQRRRR